MTRMFAGGKRLLLAGIAALSMSGALQAAAQEAAPAQSGAVLREVDIRVFIEDVAKATGRTFIVDPRVQGKVTVISPAALNERELFDMFQSTLRVHGYVAVPTARGAYRIVPSEVAAREPGSSGAGADDRYITQVFPLRFADAETVANALKPMLSERGQVSATRRGNSLIAVDYGSNVNRMTEIIRRLDQDNSTFRTVKLRNTSAVEMAKLAQSMAAGVGDDASARPLLQATPMAGGNTLVLRGDGAMLAKLAPMIEQLDAGAASDSAVQVITLRYAVAEEIEPVLKQLSASMTSGQGDAAQAGRNANIASHRATNSLIINASPDVQETLARVVRSLDVRREQIRVEAIIVEVSDSAAKDLGLQFLLSGQGNNAVPFLSTSYPNSAPNLLAVTGALVAGDQDEDGDDGSLTALRRAAVNSLLGARGLVAGGGGQRDDGALFGLIVNAIGQDRDSNVLSTPSVMTLDNETANFLVGQQIPITTGESLGANNENPFRTVRREDVGVRLKVRPQISDNGAIRLQISQEVSSIFGPVSQDSADLITNRRSIETVVQVDAGQVVVLGGLIQEDIQRSDDGIPGLRKIPVAGRLFRSESKQRRRTNLMVFLRPTIVSTAEQAADVTRRQLEALASYRGMDPGLFARMQEIIQQSAPGGAASAKP
jgi:general secretion pathway protein D